MTEITSEFSNKYRLKKSALKTACMKFLFVWNNSLNDAALQNLLCIAK